MCVIPDEYIGTRLRREAETVRFVSFFHTKQELHIVEIEYDSKWRHVRIIIKLHIVPRPIAEVGFRTRFRSWRE